MNIIKPTEPLIFDNLYFKPSQLGLPSNHKHSVRVLFSVSGIIYDGQYDFVEGYWTTMPGDEWKRTFIDNLVEFWFYPPGTIDLFKKYAKDVERGACFDEVSRLTEYEESKKC
jgi:hypothetical protein